MNQTEALSLVSYLNRAGLLQALEGQAPVWADALDDVAFIDAREAARSLAKTPIRWVTPGDIRAQSAVIRRRRVQDVQPPAPPESIDPDDISGQIQWQREFWQAVGGGSDVEQADATACTALGVSRPAIDPTPRPVAQLVEAIARTTALPRVTGNEGES